MNTGRTKKQKQSGARTRRLETLDLIRGLTLVSMILYHGMWDFVYLTKTGAGLPGLRDWYAGSQGFFWQQTICWSFILLSGFCIPFSRRILRRGLQVTGAGLVVTAVTLLFMYEERVLFGVLTFLGAAMLLTGAVRRLCSGSWEKPLSLSRGAAAAGLVLSAVLFYVTRWINQGVLQLGPGLQAGLPGFLYAEGPAGWILTGLGFPMKGFFSTDYFSLVPWIFLFWTGTFLHYVVRGGVEPDPAGTGAGRFSPVFSHPFFHQKIGPLNWMGEHSLLVYLIHQPLLYLVITFLF
ncbi:MAG: DUF1624 domain-containing protein [Lachnospiraceae bacterium]|nr:DUF1624 domain-containing protein [Lachnospiraceae bacterium]